MLFPNIPRFISVYRIWRIRIVELSKLIPVNEFSLASLWGCLNKAIWHVLLAFDVVSMCTYYFLEAIWEWLRPRKSTVKINT
jgi:hypothetical protein